MDVVFVPYVRIQDTVTHLANSWRPLLWKRGRGRWPAGDMPGSHRGPLDNPCTKVDAPAGEGALRHEEGQVLAEPAPAYMLLDDKETLRPFDAVSEPSRQAGHRHLRYDKQLKQARPPGSLSMALNTLRTTANAHHRHLTPGSQPPCACMGGELQPVRL